MEIKGVTRDQLATAIEHADPGSPSQPSNLHFRRHDALNRAGTRWAITLTIWDSRGHYSRRSAIPSYSGGKSRRISAACWHAHRDFLAALFAVAPDAVIRSSLAVYRGQVGFEATFPFTYYHNAGSMIDPQAYGSLCDCEEGA